MKVLIFALFLSAVFPAHSASPKTCIEMMKLHYTWIDLEKCDRAAKQLESAELACRSLLKSVPDREELTRLASEDERLVFLYEKLLNKNANPQSICPKKTKNI